MKEYQKFNDAINGFSPSFARILLEKLKEKKKETISATKGPFRNHDLDITPFVAAILYHLRSRVLGDREQIPRKMKGWEIVELVLDTIDATEEFLTLFEVPKKSKLISTLGPGIEEISAEDLIKEFSKFTEGGIPKEITGGFITRLSPCHQVPIEITNGGLRQEICSKCREPIRETRFKE